MNTRFGIVAIAALAVPVAAAALAAARAPASAALGPDPRPDRARAVGDLLFEVELDAPSYGGAAVAETPEGARMACCREKKSG